jgi:hypothetical protein
VSAPTSATALRRASLAEDTVHRLGPLLPEVRLELGVPHPPIPADRDLSLALPGAGQGPRLERALEIVEQRTGVAERRVRAAYLQGWYAWYVLAPVLVAYHALGRVPALGPPDVPFAWDGEERPTVWLAGPLTVLTDDALAGDPDALAVPSRDALRDRLHDGIVDHMSALIPWLKAGTGLGARMQWLQTADVISSVLQLAGERVGHEAAGIAEAGRLTGRAGSPLRSPAGRFMTWRHEDLERILYHRASCCLWWRSGEDAWCMTCPLLRADQQAIRVHDWMTTLA